MGSITPVTSPSMSVLGGVQIKLAWFLEVLIIPNLNALSGACVTNVDLFVKLALAGGSSRLQEGAALSPVKEKYQIKCTQ